jgi:hypothetical protein
VAYLRNLIPRVVLHVDVFKAERTNCRHLRDVLAGLCPILVLARRVSMLRLRDFSNLALC